MYSACTRFDYRSRFEDRLIASSVDEEAEEEVVGSLVPTATATTTCRLPPGFREMDPRHGRADWIRPTLAVLCERETMAFSRPSLPTSLGKANKFVAENGRATIPSATFVTRRV